MNSIAIGSRAHLEKESMATRSIFRTILMLGFHFVVWFFTVRSIEDTQCGFKMFGRNVARVLFNHMHVEKWAFDVELLFLAERIKCNIGESAVNWMEIDGSKIVPVFSWIQMGIDVISISLMYTIGAWTFPLRKEQKFLDEKKETFGMGSNMDSHG
ncbi:dolichyl-phosphate beta-glucosyltransferase-like [Panonychus citri]|uniref:dolichyl-phosphate beta-glucosyltransferase-like n=1 Tax=Panonychus citri TaxID=50023 RepID=UPI002307867F|nr:dolichyl-phosphate beta-glucosyltransferase-like [Panonychus citri]